MADISIKSSHLETHSRMYKQQSHEVPSGVEPMNTVYRTKEYDLFINFEESIFQDDFIYISELG